MEITLQLSIRIALVWAGGFLIALLVRAVLPDQTGVNISAPSSSYFVSFSRLGFWTCILAALTVTGLVVFRAMATDLARSQMH